MCDRAIPEMGVDNVPIVDDELDELDELEAADGPINVASDPIATARRRHGAAGAALAAGMVAINDILLMRPPKEEAPIVVASPTEPTDIDADGIHVPVDEARSVFAPPQPPADPFPPRRPRRR